MATREDVAGLEAQISRLETSVDDMEKKQADLAQKLTEIKRPVDSLNSNLMDTQNLLNNFNPKFEELRSMIEALRKDLAERSKDIAKNIGAVEQNLQAKLAALKKASPSKSGAAKAKPSAKTTANGEPPAENQDSAPDAPLKLFEAAYKDYLGQRWDLAEAGFENYLKTHPEGSLADKSLYYRALSLKHKNRFAEAHDDLDKLSAKFPKSSVTRSGMLEKAKLYFDESKTAEAEGMLEYLAMTQQGTKEAEQAKDLLKQIPHKQ